MSLPRLFLPVRVPLQPHAPCGKIQSLFKQGTLLFTKELCTELH